ncbi:MAG: hypothetical protein IPN42_02575 [Methylococcaceae bacterium]|nr:hypothetical protein [Methylococcaceae bacterium]
MFNLKIKRDDLIEALSNNLDSLHGGWFLDTETGAVLLNSDAIDDLPEDVEDNPRYLTIECIDSHVAFTIMTDFVAELNDSKETRRLAEALSRPKPFRQFKDTLVAYPKLREAWFAYEEAAYLRLAERWCDHNGIEAEWI